MFTNFENMASSSSTRVHFFFDNVSLSLKNRGKLKRFIGSIFTREGQKVGRINYVFCNDRTLLEMNRHYLKHDFYTDILTFILSCEGEEIVADIFISIDRIRENAKVLKVTLKQELHRVLFHGALHLCGYNDKLAMERKSMRQKEDFYLSRYFRRFT